jgi:hypothetical protein
MKIEPFVMERWQSVWENRVELNISESGVAPMTLEELVGSGEELQRLLALPLGYPQTNGSEETRAAVARLYPGATAANVLMTSGGSEANYVTTWGLVEPGDELVFVQPHYMQIKGVAGALGALVKPVWLREELKWQPDLDELRRAITPKTRLIAVCNPNNPTGAVLNEEAMTAICRAAQGVGAWVVADEIYRGAEREGDAVTPSFWGRYERVLCTSGFSKAYGLPGLRVGWVAGPAEVIDRLWGYHDYTSIAFSAVSDRLAALALEPKMHARIFERTRGLVRQHYPVLAAWIARHAERITHVPPAAGAIAWLGWRGRGSVDDMAQALLDRKSVLIVPGSQFEMPGHMRIGFGYDAEKLSRALARMDEIIAEPAAAAAS